MEEPKGRKLGDEGNDDDLEPAVRNLTFWKNGFSIDDGPLYEYSDPKNQKYLEAIKSGLFLMQSIRKVSSA